MGTVKFVNGKACIDHVFLVLGGSIGEVTSNASNACP